MHKTARIVNSRSPRKSRFRKKYPLFGKICTFSNKSELL